jgi:hypothetical protein
MFNTRTFYGTDGTLTMARQTAVDADTLTSYLGEGSVVGRVTGVGLSVATKVRAFHEMGSRLPRELRSRSRQQGTQRGRYVAG